MGEGSIWHHQVFNADGPVLQFRLRQHKWIYNDNVNSPEIRQWLGKVVGREGETLDRHDRWLCMMYPRLQLLKQLLSRDGLLAISIDDNEVSYLGVLLDE